MSEEVHINVDLETQCSYCKNSWWAEISGDTHCKKDVRPVWLCPVYSGGIKECEHFERETSK